MDACACLAELSRAGFQIVDCQPLAAAYADSTHQVYRLVDAKGRVYALKQSQRASSPFWHQLRCLFGFDLAIESMFLPAQVERLNSMGGLPVAVCLAVGTEAASDSSYQLNAWYDGASVAASAIKLPMVQQLAAHMAALHRHESDYWGTFRSPAFSAARWWSSLVRCVPDAVDLVAVLPVPKAFVPWMADLRWDQFLHDGQSLSVLVDAEAFVYAPKALDFVLLEYLLTAEQLGWWRDAYVAAGGEMPTIAQERLVYRQLLWSMQVLGEVPAEIWYQQPMFFN